MLAEAINTIATMARDAAALEIRKIEGEPRVVLVRQGTELKERALPAPLRRHIFFGIYDLVAAAKDQGMTKAPEVFFNSSSVELVHDRDDRREVSAMPLAFTQRFRLIESMAGGKSYSPKDAIKLLRYQLDGTGVEAVVESLRRVDFEENERGGSAVKHGAESFGRQVELKVLQADKIPDEFTCQVPVFTNPGLRVFEAPIRMGLFLDLVGKKVELGPIADQLDNARQAALAYVREVLASGLQDVPIFQGAFGSSS